MRFRGQVLLLLAIITASGCQTNPVSAPSSTQPASIIPPDRILVQFQTMDCPCDLGDINAALMDLDGVSSVKWDYDRDRVFLVFLDQRRPTDEQITRALRLTPVVIRRIERP